ncbi:MAG TPA: hypothetical protein VFC95_02895 [Guyparkeria sp.]|nr:hypothetical protein [Guyparkeria sp.]
MNWQAIRPLDRRTGLEGPPSRYAIRSSCGRWQISLMAVGADKKYWLWDRSTRPATRIELHPTPEAAKRQAKELNDHAR